MPEAWTRTPGPPSETRPGPQPRLPETLSPETLSRRALLGRGAALAGGALAAPWLAGCAASAAPRTDVSTLAGAIASEQDLVATYEAAYAAARAAESWLAKRLAPVLAHHRAHLGALRRHYVPGSGDRADEGGAIPPPRAVPVPLGGGALALLRDLENRAAEARTADAAKATPALAQLLASIGACEAGHAVTVKGQPPAVGTRSAAEALQRALAAEHAAVYGYGVLGARLAGTLRGIAESVWAAHRAQRDRLIAIASGTPVAAAPAYRLPVRPTSARSAAQLAAALEDGLVPAYVGLAGVSSPDLRAFAADGARRAVARSAGWRSRAGAAMPSDAFPGLPDAAVEPRPEPGE
ncbi:ferritin-like domain-containing protein [Actinomadura chibensis]|uniref:ferritin-like domain-containing protein n=1 Tax=Actinomadura chibensis TaxID=392828 RepID=UPI000A7941C0|nr:ferritin-like domain-containing protein [Actinomadura chibensis]